MSEGIMEIIYPRAFGIGKCKLVIHVPRGYKAEEVHRQKGVDITIHIHFKEKVDLEKVS